MYDVTVIGGGASGMMAAVSAAQAGARTLLLERNEKLGKKVYITGKGRCNVTNAADRDSFFANILRNPRFFYASFARLSNQDFMALLESWGVPLKTERGGRVFPVSDHASDVTRAFERQLRSLGAEVSFFSRVSEILTRDGHACGVKLENGQVIESSCVVLATGGKSYPTTGSTGDGYALAGACGHGLVRPLPALCPVETKETWPGELSGLTLKNVALTARRGQKEIYSDMGEMLFTHFGLSGPLVLSLSSCLPEDPAGVELTIDLKPALDRETLDRRLLRELTGAPNRRLISVAETLEPRSLAAQALRLAKLPPDLPANSVTRAQRETLLDTLKALPLTVKGLRGMEEAIITRGGLPVKEFSPSTLESKKLPGLFASGEVLDLDALTGGFNLQIAFSTGALAGESAAIRALER